MGWTKSQDATTLDLSKAKEIFPRDVETDGEHQGPIDVLIGTDHMGEAPRE
jgi:hypothetical protein